MARFIAYVQTNRIGSRCDTSFEVPDDELADRQNDAERDELISSYAQDAIANDWDWGWDEVES